MNTSFPTDLTPQAAIRLQKRYAPLVKRTGKIPRIVHSLVGCDAAYLNGITIAAAVSVRYDNLAVTEVQIIEEKTTFPYIPGLLAFREAPAVLNAIWSLRVKSYICMVDGHGVAHPREFGLASHVGLMLGHPTIGIAKSLLYGAVQRSHVVDRDGSELAERITLPKSKKIIYVSIGHGISLDNAVKVVKNCLTPQGPIPIRRAHEEVTKRKWEIKGSSPVS